MDSLILGLRVLVALGAVLGLMWFLQRRIGAAKGRGRRSAGRTLSVVSRQSVGQKASVVVIDAGGQRFLLGVTEHNISVLHSAEAPAEAVESATAEHRVAASVLGPGAVSRGTGSFAEVLQETAVRSRRSQLHGSLLAGSTWRQAAAAIRGRHH